MSERAINFSAGPCTLPLSVLEEAQAEFVDFGGLGMSLIEMSHRSKAYQGVQDTATDLAREVFQAPDDFDVLFLGGGATLQFAMVAMNLLGQGRKGAYVDSGAWGGKALQDATHHGDAYSAWTVQNPATAGCLPTPSSSFSQARDISTSHPTRRSEGSGSPSSRMLVCPWWET